MSNHLWRLFVIIMLRKVTIKHKGSDIGGHQIINQLEFEKEITICAAL